MRWTCLFTFVLWSAAAGGAEAESIRVGAAVSLRDAFADLAPAYAAASGDTVDFVYGSSGQVATQITSGAAIDAFVSAANKQVDDLTKAGKLDASTHCVVAGNTLVLIVPAGAADAPKSFEALADASTKRVALGEPKTVPAGQYAQQVLKSMKLEAALDGKLVYGTNVRQVLAYVERGEVSAGIVYATDAKASIDKAGDKVKVAAVADEKSHEPIVYPAAVVAGSAHAAAAKKFLDFLATPKAQAALAACGFTPPAGR